VQPEKLAAAVDENTIGVGAVLGTTYTGAFEDVETLDKLIGAVLLLRIRCEAHLTRSRWALPTPAPFRMWTLDTVAGRLRGPCASTPD